MKVLVCGGRNYDNMMRVDTVLDYVQKRYTDLEIIHGGASGADSLAGEWAHTNYVICHIYPANWPKYGKSAGYIRNAQMLASGKPDIVIAFPGGKGTTNMIEQAKAANIKVYQINE